MVLLPCFQVQKRFTFSEVTANRHEIMIPQRIMRPSITLDSEQLDSQCSTQTYHHPQLTTTGLHPVVYELLLISHPTELAQNNLLSNDPDEIRNHAVKVVTIDHLHPKSFFRSSQASYCRKWSATWCNSNPVVSKNFCKYLNFI